MTTTNNNNIRLEPLHIINRPNSSSGYSKLPTPDVELTESALYSSIKPKPAPNMSRPGTVNDSFEGGQVLMDQNSTVIVAGDRKKSAGHTENGFYAAAGARNPNQNYGKLKFFDYNFHAMKKGVSSALLDVSLLMANTSQLKSVIVAGPDAMFYHPMLVLLIISIAIQVVVGCILIWLGRININEADEDRQNQAETLNNVVVIGIFIMTLVNVFIASLGIGQTKTA